MQDIHLDSGKIKRLHAGKLAWTRGVEGRRAEGQQAAELSCPAVIHTAQLERPAAFPWRGVSYLAARWPVLLMPF